MEAIVRMIMEKSGISEPQAKTAVETVLSFLKDKMPQGIGAQIESVVNGDQGSGTNTAEEIKDKISGVFGM